MKEQLMNEVLQAMLPYINNQQGEKLVSELHSILERYNVTKADLVSQADGEKENDRLLDNFISAKRIEGCSEKTLAYYRKTICVMTGTLNKPIKCLTTDDLRGYLTEYQEQKKSSKVTIDNIRRILYNEFSKDGIVVKQYGTNKYIRVEKNKALQLHSGDEIYFEMDTNKAIGIECGGKKYSFIRMARFMEEKA